MVNHTTFSNNFCTCDRGGRISKLDNLLLIVNMVGKLDNLVLIVSMASYANIYTPVRESCLYILCAS